MTVGPCGKIAGLTEQKATAQPDTGAGEESFRSHPGQLPDPPIGTVSHGVSFCAIGIRAEATACPARGNEQDERTEAGKRALSHRNRIYAGGFPVQVKLAVRRVPDLVIRNAR